MLSKFGIREDLFTEFQSISVLFMFITPQDPLEESVLLGREAHGRHRSGSSRCSRHRPARSACLSGRRRRRRPGCFSLDCPDPPPPPGFRGRSAQRRPRELRGWRRRSPGSQARWRRPRCCGHSGSCWPRLGSRVSLHLGQSSTFRNRHMAVPTG